MKNFFSFNECDMIAGKEKLVLLITYDLYYGLSCLTPVSMEVYQNNLNLIEQQTQAYNVVR